MKFTYKNNDYELMETKEPHNDLIFDMIVIFKIKYVIITKDLQKIEVSENEKYDFEDYAYINYFCKGAGDAPNEWIEIAKEYIDDYTSN